MNIHEAALQPADKSRKFPAPAGARATNSAQGGVSLKLFYNGTTREIK